MKLKEHKAKFESQTRNGILQGMEEGNYKIEYFSACDCKFRWGRDGDLKDVCEITKGRYCIQGRALIVNNFTVCTVEDGDGWNDPNWLVSGELGLCCDDIPEKIWLKLDAEYPTSLGDEHYESYAISYCQYREKLLTEINERG